jgi:RNA polymerase sigma-70 factor, ECF subfamily
VALAGCVEKLSESDRRLLVECYAPGAVVKDVAELWRRTTTSVYRSLRRIRETLAICIDRQLREAT